jgi:glycogen debranching enzyme
VTTGKVNEEPSTAEPRRAIGQFALKQGNGFMVCDALGDISDSDEGLFSNDTRILSRWKLAIGGSEPSLLGVAVGQDNVLFRSNLSNRRLPPLGGRSTPRGIIHLERTRFLWKQRMFERLVFTNYGEQELTMMAAVEFDADFVDVFELRGTRRQKRGRRLESRLAAQAVELRYEGLDRAVRRCAISFSFVPDALGEGRVEWRLSLPPGTHRADFIEVGPDSEAGAHEARFRSAAACAHRAMRSERRRGASTRSSARLFDRWVEKSRADLALLTTELDTGPYPYAGIPWFCTPFGRDGIITALQLLWLAPQLARGVLAFLAATQAKTTSRADEAEPGKVLHEMRLGEMAALGEVPFRRYYGGVDATPLFIVLAGEYARRTGDMAFIDQLWPSLTAAMKWIDGPGDSNRDGLLDYTPAPPPGLANQGWKDSSDSIFHADGRFPPGPIAVVEVQGYAFAARLAMSDLAARRGDPEGAREWRSEAQLLRRIVEARFWMPEANFYGIAVDGEGQLCRVRASNVGHLLYVGLPSAARARHVSEQLLAGGFNAGWGLRTLAAGQKRFNPMSYHNGSVWPHDTAICAAGMARYGHKEGAATLLDECFGAAVNFGMRLPELYCGFARAPGEPPVGYPVACLPQAWSAGSVFMLLQACLGVQVDAHRRIVRIDRPLLPIGMDRFVIDRLGVGDDTLSLLFERRSEKVAVSFTQPAGGRARVVLRV